VDRQPYYRLSVADKEGDSAWKMAESLCAGDAVHGDLALVEAIGSLEAFYHLVSIGVPFPLNEMGAPVGEGSELDPRQRTSFLEPSDSRLVWERLLSEIRTRGIPILEGRQAIALVAAKPRLTEKPSALNQKPSYSRGRVYGALFIDAKAVEQANFGLELILADAVVVGTGGPGGLYSASAYPESQAGAIGLAVEIGAACANLTESQFGLAAVPFRCRITGPYMQAVPRYFSRGPDGDEEEFLTPLFESPEARDSSVFHRGNHGTFDARNALEGGSSLVDLFVHRERVLRGRRVFLDFRHNPGGWNPAALGAKEHGQLERLDALGGTPIDRLRKLAPFAEKQLARLGIDLEKEPLEIAVCALHSNGGLTADTWWESVNIEGLFPVGEVNGSHGICPPDGATLNASQVGGLRAARRIAGNHARNSVQDSNWQEAAQEAAQTACEEALRIILAALDESGKSVKGDDQLRIFSDEFRQRMDKNGSILRFAEGAREAARMSLQQVRSFHLVKIGNRKFIPELFRDRHLVIAHAAYLEAIAAFVEARGGSRGSSLMFDPDGAPLHPALDPAWKALEEKTSLRGFIQIVRYTNGAFRSDWETRRPVPASDDTIEDMRTSIQESGISSDRGY
jgi:succinate dehydrogenase/fumarate reductase flavoprotein subunit